MYREDVDGRLIPMVKEYEGKEMVVIDVAQSQSGERYYVLGDSEGTESNIFLESKEGVLTQLTDSDTMKYALTYSPASGSLTYTATTAQDLEALVTESHDIMQLNLNSPDEVKVAEGFSAVPLDTGAQLFVRDDEGIKLTQLQSSSTPVMVLPLAIQDLVSIHPSEATVIAYNPTTRAIDIFTINPGGFLTYASSLQANAIPTAITFFDGKVIAARSLAGEERDDYEVWYPENDERHPVLAPESRKGIPPIMTIRSL
jgi:hypothetical protein